MVIQKQTKVTAWLALPAGWAKTHQYKSKEKKKYQPKQNNKKLQATNLLPPTSLTKMNHTSHKHSSSHAPSIITHTTTWKDTSSLFQCNLQGQRLIDADLQPFGDIQKPKLPTHFRIEQHNINNIPENSNAFKSQTLV